jgi:hypothetical protein
MARKDRRAAPRAAANAPPRAETEAEKMERLRLLRLARDAGLLPAPGTVAPAPPPPDAPVLRSKAPLVEPAPALDMHAITRAERRHVPAPPRHAPELEAKRDEFLCSRALARAGVTELAAIARTRPLTPAELATLAGRLAGMTA